MNDINELVERLSLSYLVARGNTFKHLGVQLPLNQEVLTMAIQNNIVGAHLEHAGGKQGREDALLMLRHMVAGEALTPLGVAVVAEMNKAFCADVRQMLDEGKDPIAELAREQTGRATQ